MIVLQLLEDSDTIQATDFCRPLYRIADFESHSDAWISTSIGGTPCDHLKWAPVRCCLGPCWIGKTVGDFLQGKKTPILEFVRGPLPKRHILKGFPFLF